MAAAASWWGAQTFGRCAPRMPALGSIRKCAQSMHAATSQDVEIMLGVDGTISRGVFFLFLLFRAPVNLNSMFKRVKIRVPWAFFPFLLSEQY